MRLYMGFVSNSIQKALAYRTNIWMKLLGKIIYLLVQVCIWKALYVSNIKNDMPVTLNTMVTYVVISNVISTFIEFDIIGFINDKIRSGDIAIDLMKPFNYVGYIFCYGIGGNIVNLFFQTIPLVICAVIFVNVKFALNDQLILFLLSLCCSLIISFFYAFFIGILAFWLYVTWPLNMLMSSIYKLLSGMCIQIWFFPYVLKKIVAFLPFRYIYYTPILILNQPNAENYKEVLLQCGWIGILSIIVFVTWAVGRKKLVIQGG